MMPLDLPSEFIETIRRSFSRQAQDWLRALPGLVAECVQQWNLSNLTVCQSLSFNLVCFADAPDFGKVVLKIGVPHLDLFSEMEAIQLFAGHGICRCYAVDRERGAMLLERVLPGQDLRIITEADERYRIAADLYRQIRIAVPNECGLPTYQQLIERAIDRIPQNPQVPSILADWLYQIRDQHQVLVDEAHELVVLHCDLHHMNILRDGAGWKLIDPKGFIGVPAMECIRFMQNELDLFPPEDQKAAIEKMISLFAAALGVSDNAVKRCFLIDTVLSCYWGFEDSPEQAWLQVALDLCRFIEKEIL